MKENPTALGSKDVYEFLVQRGMSSELAFEHVKRGLLMGQLPTHAREFIDSIAGDSEKSTSLNQRMNITTP